MSQPVLDLQRLIASRKAISGRVVAVTDGMVRVATAQGVVELAGDGALQVGDRVTIRNGKVTKIQGQNAPSIHFV